jgi:ribulose-5-phosphate 4-epimerase/fuculose-1-phosphate aldolase
VVVALGQKPAILLRGNGQVTVGKNLPEAIVMAVYLEETADIYYGALQIGTPIRLSPVEAGSRKDEILPDRDLTRTWDFFKAKIETP